MKNILVVDDSASMRMLVSFTLKDAGFNVILSSSGEEALMEVKSSPVSMIITDLNMDKMNGIELIMAIRQLADYKNVPILMLTTEGAAETMESGKGAVADAWITKPFSPVQLLSTVNTFLN